MRLLGMNRYLKLLENWNKWINLSKIIKKKIMAKRGLNLSN